MPLSSAQLRRAIPRADLAASVRAGVAVVVLFALGLLAARHWADAIAIVLSGHERMAMSLFVLTSVVAVLLPMLSNRPLVPYAALAWGAWWTAGLLLGGWIAGATLSFVLGRFVGPAILQRFPSVRRHADIDRLIHPRHRLRAGDAAGYPGRRDRRLGAGVLRLCGLDTAPTAVGGLTRDSRRRRDGQGSTPSSD